MQTLRTQFFRPSYLLNFKIIFFIIGKLLMGLSIAMLFPLMATFSFSENDWIAFVVPALITFFSGFLLSKWCQTSEEMSAREGFSIVASVWWPLYRQSRLSKCVGMVV